MLFTVPQGVVPSVVVGVVGIGHVEGITENWDKEINVKELLRYGKTMSVKCPFFVVVIVDLIRSFSLILRSVFRLITISPFIIKYTFFLVG